MAKPTKNNRYQNSDSSSIYNIKQNLNEFLGDLSNIDFNNLVKNDLFNSLDSATGNSLFDWVSSGVTTSAYDLNTKYLPVTFVSNGFIEQPIYGKLKRNTDYTLVVYGSSEVANSIEVSVYTTNPYQIFNQNDTSEIDQSSLILNESVSGLIQKHVLNFRTTSASAVMAPINVRIRNISGADTLVNLKNIMVYASLIELGDLPDIDLPIQPNISIYKKYIQSQYNYQGVAVSGATDLPYQVFNSLINDEDFVTINQTERITNKTLGANCIWDGNTLPVTGGGTGVTTATGTSSVVRRTSPTLDDPTVNDSIIAGTTTINLLNTNASTINAFGAASTLNIGSTAGTTTVNNNMVVQGDMTVNGTTTTMNSTVVTVDDKNIELGSIASPTNVTASGGGLTLKGDTDKTINWNNDAVAAWTSSENVNVATGKGYYVNNNIVLSDITLGDRVVNSNLQHVGDLVTGSIGGTIPIDTTGDCHVAWLSADNFIGEMYGLFSGASSGTNMGDLSLTSANSGLVLTPGTTTTNQKMVMGTPSTLSPTTSNLVTGSTHTHLLSEVVSGSGTHMGTTRGVNQGDLTLTSANSGLVLTAGTYNSNQSMVLGTPSTLTPTTTNLVSGASHTHLLTDVVSGTGQSINRNNGDLTLTSANSGLVLTPWSQSSPTVAESLVMGTPSTLSTTTVNAVTGSSHTHLLTAVVSGSGTHRGTASGSNLGDVTLVTNSGFVLNAGTYDVAQSIGLGTPSSITTGSTNSVTSNSHTHYITGFAVGSGTAYGPNNGDVTLAANHGLGLSGQVINMGTPSTVTRYTANQVSGSTHTHAWDYSFIDTGYTKIDGSNVTPWNTWNINIAGNAATATKVIGNSTLGSPLNLVYGSMASNDYFHITVGDTGSDQGYVEISTGDNGNEPVYVRQYSSGALTRQAILLGASGETTFPVSITVPILYGNISGNADTVDNQHFSWANNDNNPTYLWSASSSGSGQLARRDSITVGYSSYAAEATNNAFFVRGTSPTIYLVDNDQAGGQSRAVHHNSGLIGFLNSTGNWVLYCNENTTYGSFSGPLAGRSTNAGYVDYDLTFSSAGDGHGPGSTYNGSAARTISYNSIGAAPAHSHPYQPSGTYVTSVGANDPLWVSGTSILPIINIHQSSATQPGYMTALQWSKLDGIAAGATAGITGLTLSGTGISSTVNMANASNPIITVSLGAITPTTVNGVTVNLSSSNNLNIGAVNSFSDTNSYQTNIGYQNSSGGYSSVALGMSCVNTGHYGISIGYQAKNLDLQSNNIAIGCQAKTTTGNVSIAIGSGATTTANKCIAIGSGATTTANNCIAIGADVSVGTANSIIIGNPDIVSTVIKGSIYGKTELAGTSDTRLASTAFVANALIGSGNSYTDTATSIVYKLVVTNGILYLQQTS